LLGGSSIPQISKLLRPIRSVIGIGGGRSEACFKSFTEKQWAATVS
jgi:hypothetical protein